MVVVAAAASVRIVVVVELLLLLIVTTYGICHHNHQRNREDDMTYNDTLEMKMLGHGAPPVGADAGLPTKVPDLRSLHIWPADWLASWPRVHLLRAHLCLRARLACDCVGAILDASMSLCWPTSW